MFRFKQFSIQQEKAAFKVGTDSCLFGAWLSVEGINKALDVGTGTGLLSLMLCQRDPSLTITAIEKHHESAEEANCNFEQSPWSSNLQLIQADYREWASKQSFDLILSNPPYFRNSKHSSEAEKSLARHQEGLSSFELLSKAKNLLNPEGRIAMILPVFEMSIALKEAADLGLFPLRICKLRPLPHKDCHRVMVELRQTEQSPISEEIIIEYERGGYSPEATLLLKDFLLKL